MISITTQLLTSLLNTLGTWLNYDSIKVLISMLVIAYVVRLVKTLLN